MLRMNQHLWGGDREGECLNTNLGLIYLRRYILSLLCSPSPPSLISLFSPSRAILEFVTHSSAFHSVLSAQVISLCSLQDLYLLLNKSTEPIFLPSFLPSYFSFLPISLPTSFSPFLLFSYHDENWTHSLTCARQTQVHLHLARPQDLISHSEYSQSCWTRSPPGSKHSCHSRCEKSERLLGTP